MSALRDQLLKEFDKVDTDKTGLISLSELEALVKKLNPSFTADELKAIASKLSVVDDKVKFKEFVDMFTGGTNKNVQAALAKPPSEGELKDLREVFAKYDKDASGQIDLKELQAMCGDLGKKLPDEQAAGAMQQLDKNGDMRCDFEEFLLWYTCTPGLGGYSHVALGFMKAQLAMKGGIRKITKRARKTIDNVDEFAFKGTLEVSSDANPSKEACSATFGMRKAEGPTNAVPRITVQVTAKDPDTAASLIAKIEAFVNDPEDPCPLPITCRQDKDKMFFSVEAPSDMFEDEGLVKGLGFLEECVKKFEGKVTLAANFQDALKNLDRPLLLHFQGAKVSADINVGLTALVNFFARDGIPPEAEASLKVVAAILKDSKVTYNEVSIMAIAAKLREKLKSSPWTESQAEMVSTAMGSLSDARTKLYGIACASGGCVDGRWGPDGKPEKAEAFVCLIREMGAGIVTVDEVIVDGIPNSTVQLICTFEKVNPFPMVDYMLGSYPKDPNGGKEAMLVRTQSADETSKLKLAFAKFDKDGSGAIDLKELRAMIEDLGGKLSDEECEEAMVQLDTNKDGTCNFEEFQALWSSKANLGGHSNMTLKFMKMKLGASNMLDKGKRFLGGASGYVGELASEDTVIKFSSEVSPKLEEVVEKMSATFAIQQIDEKATGPPRAEVSLGCKSAEAADEIVKKVNGIIATKDGLKEMMEMVGVSLTVTNTGKIASFAVTPPESALEGIYGEEDMMKVLTPLIKALRQSNAKSVFANEFDDFLAKPDTPMPEVFAGSKVTAELFAASQGKNIFLNSLPVGEGLDPKDKEIIKEVVNMLAGAEINHSLGYHPVNLSALLKVNEMIVQVATPSGLREMMAGFAPFDEMPMTCAEVQDIVDAGVYVLDRLESIESVGIVNVDLPVEFAANKKPATVGATITGKNVKPFGLVKYLVEPTLARFMTKAAEEKAEAAAMMDAMMDGEGGGAEVEMA